MKIASLIFAGCTREQAMDYLENLLGRPLVSYLAFSAAECSDVYLLSGGEAQQFAGDWNGENRFVPMLDDKQNIRSIAQVLADMAADYTHVLLLPGNLPLLSADTLKDFFKAAASQDEVVLGLADADSQIYLCETAWLSNLDVPVSILMDEISQLPELPVYELNSFGEMEFLLVQDRMSLAEATAELRWKKNSSLMENGVTLIDPAGVYVDYDVKIGPGTVLEPQVLIHGNTVIGSDCHIGPFVRILDSQIGDGCDVGPFCYLRPGTELAEKVKAGHFVEMKKSKIGKGSKVPHLSYLGDTTVGEGVNIGCGTITCNYDGVNKHKTVIEDQVFIGSNTNLVAPVTIGARSTVAAGSTITEDVPADHLGIARGRQRNVSGWTEKKDPRFTKKEENR